MEPISLIVSALTAGATAVAEGALDGLKSEAATLIKDAYASLKDYLKGRFSKVPVEVLENDPSSVDRQNILKNDLQKEYAHSDQNLLALSTELIRIINEQAPETLRKSGFCFESLNSGGDIIIDTIASNNGASITARDISAKGNIIMKNMTAANEVSGENPSLRQRGN